MKAQLKAVEGFYTSSDRDAFSGRTAIVVVGMMRSGTSAVAGTLGLLGCGLPGDSLHPSPSNPKGYFESRALIALYDRILASVENSPLDWGAFPAWWHDTQEAQIYVDRTADLLRRTYGGESHLVMKNPRFCGMFPLVERALKRLGAQMRVVIPFRHPVEVARSEVKYHGISAEHAHLLWLRRVLDGEFNTRGQRRVFVHYPDLLADWRQTAAKMERGLGVTWAKDTKACARAVEAFLDPSLKHEGALAAELDDVAASRWIVPAYEAMLALNADAEDKAAPAVLDGIRQAFDHACAAFSPAMASYCNSQQDRFSSVHDSMSDKAVNARLAMQLQAMRDSTSWRLTGPLRALVEGWRRIAA